MATKHCARNADVMAQANQSNRRIDSGSQPSGSGASALWRQVGASRMDAWFGILAGAK